MPPFPKLKVAGLVILLFVVFLLAPIVPYVQSVGLPGQSGSTNVWGLSTPSYLVAGYGSPPFASAELVTVGSHAVIAYFDGGRLAAVEDAGPAGVQFNPRGVIWVQDAEVTSFDFGFLNITIRVQNLGLRPIDGAKVYLSMTGFSANSSADGTVLVQPRIVGDCPDQIQPGGECVVAGSTPNLLPANKSVSFYPEVRGSVNEVPFVFRQGFSEAYPTGGVGPIWIKAFMDRVDNARGAPLVENSTLDRFAWLRFNTSSANYEISDYGLANDTSRFFGPGGGSGVTEELLFPGQYSPNTFPTLLREYAVGQWQTLLDGQYSQFGYYVGHGPFYEVAVPCSIYEVPAAGINIPQFFQDRGCTISTLPTTWLVIILAP